MADVNRSHSAGKIADPTWSSSAGAVSIQVSGGEVSVCLRRRQHLRVGGPSGGWGGSRQVPGGAAGGLLGSYLLVELGQACKSALAGLLVLVCRHLPALLKSIQLQCTQPRSVEPPAQGVDRALDRNIRRIKKALQARGVAM